MTPVLYTSTNYQGQSFPAERDCSWVGSLGIPNDSIKSISIPNGYKVEVWYDKDYQGRSARLYKSESDLSSNKFENQISSFKITWVGTNNYPNNFDQYSFFKDNTFGQILGGMLGGGLSTAGQAIGQNTTIGANSRSDISQVTGSFFSGFKSGFLTKYLPIILAIVLPFGLLLIFFKPIKKWLSKFLK